MDKKNSPPPWIQDLLQANQRLFRDLQRQENEIREIRLIVLENQQFLREASRVSTIGVHRCNSTIRNAHTANQSTQRFASRANPAVSLASVVQRPPTTTTSHTVQRPADCSTTHASRSRNRASSEAIAAQNAAIRDAATPMPRASKPKPQAVPKICWYHKQFGQASVNCLQPCEFVAPHVPPVPAAPVEQLPPAAAEAVPDPTDVKPAVVDRQVSSISARIPLERTTDRTEKPRKRLSMSSSSSSSGSTKATQKRPADWNKMMKTSPSSSDSDSSSSDSEPAKQET